MRCCAHSCPTAASALGGGAVARPPLDPRVAETRLGILRIEHLRCVEALRTERLRCCAECRFASGGQWEYRESRKSASWGMAGILGLSPWGVGLKRRGVAGRLRALLGGAPGAGLLRAAKRASVRCGSRACCAVFVQGVRSSHRRCRAEARRASSRPMASSLGSLCSFMLALTSLANLYRASPSQTRPLSELESSAQLGRWRSHTPPGLSHPHARI